MTQTKISTRSLTLAGLMAAALCMAGPVVIPLPLSPVPLSLATLAIYLGSCLLGWKGASTACLVYLLLGLAGLPVFSGFTGGLSKLVGPTGGYLFGYLLLAAICGVFFERFPNGRVMQVTGMVLGSVVFYTIGTAWLAFAAHLTAGQALLMGVVPFLPGDALKIAVAAVAGPVLRDRITRGRFEGRGAR